MTQQPVSELRRGWTTGACATAATKAALSALWGMGWPDPVLIDLPRGGVAMFDLAERGRDGDRASAGIVKDAGDDPDVTHGCLVRASVGAAMPGAGVVFRAGKGVGTVTRPGLQLPVGEPAINPVPRQMMTGVVRELAEAAGRPADVEIEIAIPGGEEIALRTMNPRLGIRGGLSILGTTGIVIPYSCASWIHSIHRGIDVARAAGIRHVAGATGRVSERTVVALHDLPEIAVLDMGDFVGGMLKYLRRHPVPRLSIAGGFGKLVKLAQGHLDLHSARSSVDLGALAREAGALGAGPALEAAIAGANTAAEAMELCAAEGIDLAAAIATRARKVVLETTGSGVAVEVIVVDRKGAIRARVHGW